MAEDGGGDVGKRKRGGLRTMPFIFANEICERFASSGFHANMISYLTQQLNLPLVEASNILTNFAGMASLTPLIGAAVADSFAGRFWTISVGTIVYELGLICITISAVLPFLHPTPCTTQVNCQEPKSWQLSILYISLILACLGIGGIKPCVVTFGADQLDMSIEKRGTEKWSYFNLYYFAMGVATLLALTVLVYIQDNVGWGWGLGIPCIAMAVAILAFVIGSPLYNKLKPAGSPFTRLAQVVVAAIRKRNAVRPADCELLYENRELDAAISKDGRLQHTDELKFLDRAAIITGTEKLDTRSPNLWKLSTVHRVEELKSLIRIIPICSAAILLVAASSHQQSFSIQQARSMERHLTKTFQIPPATMSIFNVLTLLIGLIAYERIFIPIARKITKNPLGITSLQRMGIGFFINIFSTIAAALVEIKRKTVASHHNLLDLPRAVIPISVFWLVPQYSLHGIAEVFMAIGHMEFLYDQSPESMRSTAIALYWITIAIGNFLSTLLVTLVHKYTGKDNWLPDRNLNRGKLENYYWLVSCLQFLNFLYYLACARFYTRKPLVVIDEDVSPSKHRYEDDIGNDKVDLDQ